MLKQYTACRWCEQRIETGSTPRGGRPREYHPECRKVAKAFELLLHEVSAWEEAKIGCTPEAAKTIRRELIGLGWRMGPGRIGQG